MRQSLKLALVFTIANLAALNSIAENFCGKLVNNPQVSCADEQMPQARSCGTSCEGETCLSTETAIEVTPNWNAKYDTLQTFPPNIPNVKTYSKSEILCYAEYHCKTTCENSNGGMRCVPDYGDIVESRKIAEFHWVENLCFEN
jgi:hypothetical protein